MSWMAVGITAAAVIGGVAQNQAAKKSAGAIKGGADSATQAQLSMFYDTQAGLEPWKQSGNISLDNLQQLLGLPATGASKTGMGAVTAGGQQTGVAPEGYKSVFTSADNQEGRTQGSTITKDQFDPEAYLAQNKDVAAAGIDPWQHYLEYGRFENRRFGYREPQAAQPAPGPTQGLLTKPFGLEDFQESPAYQFNLNEGRKAIEKAAASRGTLYAPTTLQDIGKYSQGVASNEWNNAYGQYNQNMKNIWDRLYALSGSGQNAAAQQGAFGTTVGGQIGENMMGAGNAQGAGIMGGANAFTGAMGQGYNAFMMNQLLQNNQRGVSTGGGGGGIPLSNLTGAGDLNQYMG